MAENEPTLTDHLKVIIDAKPYESYSEITAEVRGMSALANYILSLDPERLIPVQGMEQVRRQEQQREQQQRENRRQGYSNAATSFEPSFPGRICDAYDNTKLLRDAIVQLGAIPDNVQVSQNAKNTFRQSAGSFVEGWNYLIPIMQAILGQNPTSQIAEHLKELEKAKGDAQRILDAMREASAPLGLSQEATHFKTAADQHQSSAKKWLVATFILSGVFFVAAVLALLAYKWEIWKPNNAYESVQLVTGKIIAFAVLSYAVLLCGRNYLANRHNAVVNRHRQNALLTYQAIVEAAKDPSNRDVVLQQAATCIFGPQPTGFTKEGLGEAPSAKSFVEFLGPIARQQ